MKILFDYDAFSIQTYGGISRYYTIIANELIQQGQDVRVFAGLHRNQYLKSLPNEIVRGINIKNFPPYTSQALGLINHFFGQIYIKNFKPDIIHETYYSSKIMVKSCAFRIASVHDMIHELYPNQFSPLDRTTEWKKNTFSRVDHIICISENTKKDLIELFDIDERKITVVHHGIDLSAFQSKTKKLAFLNKPYVLYVGSRKGYKNFDNFIKAFSSSTKLMECFDIVAFGGGAFTKVEQALIVKLGFKPEQVIHVGGGDDILSSLYQNAVAFVYPSLYEGFGLPPLEAMSAGCPVVSSNSSSIPEVVRDAGVYFDPKDIDSIKSAMESLIFSEELRQTSIEKGFKNIKKFSWQKCASETLAIYQKVTGIE